MSFRVSRASFDDANALLQLYFKVYGGSYPVAIATDRARMLEAIASDHYHWLTAKNRVTGNVVGSVIFELDRVSKIGKVGGLVVDPDVRGRGVAGELVSEGLKELFSERCSLNSIYATARTQSVAPQLLLLKRGFTPLGIFPNAHKVTDYETLALCAKFRPGVLERRTPVQSVPDKLAPILSIASKQLGIKYDCELVPGTRSVPGNELKFELVHAPRHVERLFLERCNDPYDRFYPFHKPNLMLVSLDGKIEIFAHFSPRDRYCTLINASSSIPYLSGRMKGLLTLLKEFGISYIETLIGLNRTASISTLLEERFLPSALYPAMREVNGELQDFVLLSRTLEPLNFSGMEIAQSFKPYIDQYVELWKQMHLETLEIFKDYEIASRN
jgi:RimJ/RimL family protein N-acetyltransferase